MKIVAVSDMHGVGGCLDTYGADILVMAGDIAPLRGLNHWDKADQLVWFRRDFLGFVESHPETEFVFIAGNHDFWGERLMPTDKTMPKNAHYLKDSGCEVKGVKFWGTPWVPYIGSFRRWAFESSTQMMDRQFGLIPEGIDVLVTHTPPVIEGAGVDKVNEYDRVLMFGARHLGSLELTRAILEKKPKVSLFGHIHTGTHGETVLGETRCCNVSLLDEGYTMKYDPTIVEIPD